jgi:hypothetical protein
MQKRFGHCPHYRGTTEPVEVRGRFVGSVVGIRTLDPKNWWGEGEIEVYLDGDREFPTICGTGSEDYVGLSWASSKLHSSITAARC